MGAKSQDTLQLNIEGVDSLFLHQNLMLIAAQLNVESSQAEIIQAKAYPNPNFSVGLNAYDDENRKPFYIGPQGEKSFEFDQLILLGGKRKTEIDLAKKNAEIAQYEMEDLLRNLRYQVHQTFYELARTYRVLPIYDQQLELLEELISSHEVQAKKGNVPVKDVIRLKTAYLNLSNDRSDLLKQQLEQIKQLHILLRTNSMIEPVMVAGVYGNYLPIQSADQLLSIALDNRPDLHIVNAQTDLALLNLKLQKRNAIPDLTLNTSYDQRGNAFRNQYLVGVGIPLPIWNRNRGNIKAANFQMLSADTLLGEKKMEVNAEVIAAVANMNRSVQEYQKSTALYSNDFEIVFNGESDNYRKGNISLLEFLDFLESYSQSIAEFERIKRDLLFAAEQINYVTASKIY